MALNAAPNELLSGDLTPHPWLPEFTAEQSVPPTTVPVIASAEALEDGKVQPGPVWIVAWLFV